LGFPRTLAALALFQAEAAAYLAVNRITSLRRPFPLLTGADARIRFEPRSLWLYLSFVPFCLSCAHEATSWRRLLRMMGCLLLSSLVSYRSFLRFPSPFPRPPVELPDGPLAGGWRALRAADGAGNTFPSVHTGHAVLLALMLSRDLPEDEAEVRLLWALLVSLSTLTAKQHYAVDVRGGLLVAGRIAERIHEPWQEGRLTWRAAWRELRELDRQLDHLARAPAQPWPGPAGLHPLIREILERQARSGGLVALLGRSSGRRGVLARQRALAARLRGSRLAVPAIVASAPEWLQFLRLFLEEEPRIDDGRIAGYLAEMDASLGEACREALGRCGAGEDAASAEPSAGHGPGERRDEVHETGHPEPARVPLAG
jgi:membrane-associated phospholipid phosphatase